MGGWCAMARSTWACSTRVSFGCAYRSAALARGGRTRVHDERDARPKLTRVEQAQVDRAIAHQPPIGYFVDAHGLTNECIADVDRAARPPDLTVVTHLPHLIGCGVT